MPYYYNVQPWCLDFFYLIEQDLLKTSLFAAMVPRCLAGARELATTPALAERDLVNFPPRQVFPFLLLKKIFLP